MPTFMHIVYIRYCIVKEILHDIFNNIYKQISVSVSISSTEKKTQELWLPFPKSSIFENKEKFDNISKKKPTAVLEITFKYKHNMAQPEKTVSIRISSFPFPKKNSNSLAHSVVK